MKFGRDLFSGNGGYLRQWKCAAGEDNQDWY